MTSRHDATLGKGPATPPIGRFLREERAAILAAWQAEACGRAPTEAFGLGERRRRMKRLLPVIADVSSPRGHRAAGASRRLQDAISMELRAGGRAPVELAEDLVILKRCASSLWARRAHADPAAELEARDALREAFDRALVGVTRSTARGCAHDVAELRGRAQELEGSLYWISEIAGLETFEWARDASEIRGSADLRELLGLPEGERLDVKRMLALVSPEERGVATAALRDAAARRGRVIADLRIVRPVDGQPRWVRLRARLGIDHRGRIVRALGTLLDITGEKQAETRARFLADTTHLLGASLDYERTLNHVATAAVPDIADGCAVDILRPDGTLGDFVAVVHQDPKKVELVRSLRRRRPPPLDAPRGVAKVLRTGEPELLAEVDERFLAAVAQDEQQLERLRALGIRSLLIVPLRTSGAPFGALTLAHTASGRRFGPDDVAFVEELATRASAAIDNARLHEATARDSRLRQRLINVISHDLRTPLAAIELAATLLEDDLAEVSPQLAHARTVRRNTGRITRLINDVLDLSTIEAGRLRLQWQRLDLGELLRQVLDEAAEQLDDEVELRLELALGDGRMRGDERRLHRALSTFFRYAIERARERRAATDSEREIVGVRATRRGDTVCLMVDWPGTVELGESLERLFELYWRGKAATEREIGLALFIGRGVIEAHGGRAWAERAGDDRVRFVIEL